MRSALNFRTNEGTSFFIAHSSSRAMSVPSSAIHICLSVMLQDTRLITIVQGFDEFMNIVIEDAAEVYVKDAKPRRELGACSVPQMVAAFSSIFVLQVAYC